MNEEKNKSLKNLTTFKIGGPAKYFVEVKNLAELAEALKWTKDNLVPFFIFGGGSNLLISDDGFDGLVIKMNNIDMPFPRKRESYKIENKIPAYAGMTFNKIISAGAGLALNFLLDNCFDNNLSGLENLAGIPGTLGGAIRGNAGAFGSQISDFVESVYCLDSEKNEMINLTREQCQFGYRESVFRKNKNLIIWSVRLKLFVGTGLDLSAAHEKIKTILIKRQATQPAEPSAGCIFKNIKDIEFESFLKDNHETKLPEKFLENKTIPAAWLIEQGGLKGREVGGAKVSEKHANFIINTGSATAEDVVNLINLIKREVNKKFQTNLEEEIQLLGF